MQKFFSKAWAGPETIKLISVTETSGYWVGLENDCIIGTLSNISVELSLMNQPPFLGKRPCEQFSLKEGHCTMKCHLIR